MVTVEFPCDGMSLYIQAHVRRVRNAWVVFSVLRPGVCIHNLCRQQAGASNGLICRCLCSCIQ